MGRFESQSSKDVEFGKLRVDRRCRIELFQRIIQSSALEIGGTEHRPHARGYRRLDASDFRGEPRLHTSQRRIPFSQALRHRIDRAGQSSAGVVDVSIGCIRQIDQRVDERILDLRVRLRRTEQNEDSKEESGVNAGHAQEEL